MSPSAASTSVIEVDGTTRDRILQLIASDGPVSAATLAHTLGLTPAGVRRHLALLEEDELIVVHESVQPSGTRGRPARRYVATNHGQSEMSGAYPDLASQALHFLQDLGGPGAVERFAHDRLEEAAARYALQITAVDVAGRAEQLAEALAQDGFAASARPVAGTTAVQLCQGHCPVQHVAEQFPQLCDAEAQIFSRLLGSHVQRLATLASGGHACTTNIPLSGPTSVAPHAPTAADPHSALTNEPSPPPTRPHGTWKE